MPKTPKSSPRQRLTWHAPARSTTSAAAPVGRRPWLFRLRGPVGTVLAIGGGLALIASFDPVPRAGSWWDVFADAIAWLMFLVGGCWRFWATLYIGGQKEHRVVRDGPYSVCRHPLYLGTLVMYAAVPVFLHSWTVAVILAVASVFYYVGTIPAEEAQLRAILGAEYATYCERVPRLIPRWSLFQTAAVVPVSVAALAGEARRAIRWAWLPIVADCLSQLRLSTWWPQWWLP